MLKDSLLVEVVDGWNASESLDNAIFFNMGWGKIL